MLAVVMSVLIGAACGGSGPSSVDKGYVVDGALVAASRQLIGKEYHLAPVSEPYSQQFGEDNVLFSLVLSDGKLRVEEISRLGDIYFSESLSEAHFRFHGLLRTKVDCNYVFFGDGTAVSSGQAVAHWDIGFNSTLVTKSCSLMIDSHPLFDSNIFHVDFYSQNGRMNVSYSDYPFNSATSVFQQTVSDLIGRSLSEIAICDAIQC